MPTFFFAKTLCVTRVMTCNCLRKNSTSGLAAHSLSDYRFLTFWSKPFIDIIFCIQLWIWKKVLTHLCSIALVFLLMFLRSHNIVKNALKGLLNLTGKRAQCRMWTGCSIGACNWFSTATSGVNQDSFFLNALSLRRHDPFWSLSSVYQVLYQLPLE